MTTQIIEWLNHPLFANAPAWMVAVTLAIAVSARLMAKSARPEFRSLIGVAAMVLKWVLTASRVALIPGVGPIVVRVLEAIAGVDLDGDGRIADQTPPKGLPTVPPAAVLVLSFLALGGVSCGTLGTPHVSPIPGEAGNVALDCAKQATRKVALDKIDDAASALLGHGAEGSTCPDRDWTCELSFLVTRWGSEAIDCAVAEIFGQSSSNAMASTDETEAVKAQRAEAWLTARGRISSAAASRGH